jgi:uncharacterized surface protein with fasciclin (FAS1) repeats
MQMRRACSAVVIVLAIVTAGCSSSKGKTTQPGASTSTSVAKKRNVAALAAYDGQLSTFATMLNASGVLPLVDGRGPFTVFAPTNDAFAELSHARLTALLSRAGKADLAKLIGDHVVRGRLLLKDLTTGSKKTLSGATLTVTRTGDVVTIAGPTGKPAKIVSEPLTASNGVVYRTDAVLVRS